jgi:geranylgeranyl diphosphate synthase type II
MTGFNIDGYISYWANKVNKFLGECISENSSVSKGLTTAMRYTLFAGGKRLRPALVYSSYAVFDSDFELVTPFASAVEVIHTYSLIHDDLPSMDNDDLRRGKPSNHKVFGEAVAILAGDGLLTRAFELMTDTGLNSNVDRSILCEAVYKLSKAAGDSGMVAGQYMDMKGSEECVCNPDKLVERIHLYKTAALIAYSTELGAIIAGSSEEDKYRMRRYGEKLGLAYQIADDVLDLEATADQIGKCVGKDKKMKKITYPSIKGIEESKKIAERLIEDALNIINIYGDEALPLREIARYMLSRGK